MVGLKSAIRTRNMLYRMSISTKCRAAKPLPPVTTHHRSSPDISFSINLLKGRKKKQMKHFQGKLKSHCRMWLQFPSGDNTRHACMHRKWVNSWPWLAALSFHALLLVRPRRGSGFSGYESFDDKCDRDSEQRERGSTMESVSFLALLFPLRGNHGKNPTTIRFFPMQS